MYNNFNNSFVPPYNNSLTPYSDQLIRVNGLKEAKAYRIFSRHRSGNRQK